MMKPDQGRGIAILAEPDDGELAYPVVIPAIERLGFTGWFGAEYKPRGRTEDGLGWLAAYGGAGGSRRGAA